MRKHWCTFSNAVKRSASGIALVALAFLISSAGETGALPRALPTYPVKEPVARAPQQPIQVGDRLTLQVEVSPNLIAPGHNVILRPVEPKSPPEEQGWFLDPRPSNQLGIIRFIASPLRGGSLTLPELEIVIEGADPVARTESLTLQVQELQNKTETPPDLIDVVPLQLPLRFWLMGFALMGVLAFAAYSLYRRHLRFKKATPPPAPPALPPEPDHVLARRRIEALFAQGGLTPESLKVLCFGVSETLKDYFSRRFEIDARESTTEEMLQLLRQQGLERTDLQAIRGLYLTLDQFKFLDTGSYPPFSRQEQEELKTRTIAVLDRWTPSTAEMGAKA